MSDEPYLKLAKVLNTLPNGFPATNSGLEIKLLKRIFRPEDTELFCDLRLEFETAQQIAERTGRPIAGLEDHLIEMVNLGQIYEGEIGGIIAFKMVPWAIGIYESQLTRLDREMAAMCDEYMKLWGDQFFRRKLPIMQTIPIEKELGNAQMALPYEKVSNIIENSLSFAVFDCICKKTKQLVNKGCDNPLEICTGYSSLPGAFDNSPIYHAISKEEAYAVLDKAEEAGLVHLTWNMESDHDFLCNCCGCCCQILRGINELGIPASDVINSNYYAEIDPNECTVCNTCLEDRCQVGAIEEGEDSNSIAPDKCIGCGLCISTCPTEAIKLIRKDPENIISRPKDEMDWYEISANTIGVDISRYK